MAWTCRVDLKSATVGRRVIPGISYQGVEFDDDTQEILAISLESQDDADQRAIKGLQYLRDRCTAAIERIVRG